MKIAVESVINSYRLSFPWVIIVCSKLTRANVFPGQAEKTEKYKAFYQQDAFKAQNVRNSLISER